MLRKGTPPQSGVHCPGTRLLKTAGATERTIADAAALIRDGRLVAFPTETVYGLGCDATNDAAVAAVFEAKGRPSFNPLIVHVATITAARELVAFDDRAEKLADEFWPGPLTFVLPRLTDCPVSLLAGAGLDTLAIRVPAHPVARALIEAADRPIAAPSANRSGAVSPTCAEHVAESLGDTVDLIIDDGPCAVGVEIDCSGPLGDKPAILRPGGITGEEISMVIGALAEAGDAATPRSPGQLESHYATQTPLRLNAIDAASGEALLGFGRDLPDADFVENLSPSGNLKEAAANLFAMMRRLDALNPAGIAVSPIPQEGLGAAINDRLRRAAHG